MEKKLFGTLPSGENVYLYTLENENATLKIMTRGATIVSFTVHGTDIVGGFDTLEDYLIDDSHQGAIIGRVANRIGNARFDMDGKTYHLPKNDGEHCLHGGDGFDHRIWSVTAIDKSSITLEYHSEDGEEGFPSPLNVKVTYTLSGTALSISYEAIPDGKTPIALTNHAYFNLDGFGGTIREHKAVISADRYTEVDDTLIPNGERPDVLGTAFDFTEEHAIGERIGKDFVGYDHNFILNRRESVETFGKKLFFAAKITGKRLSMNVYTDQPGIQFYIGNFLGSGPDFKGGVKQVQHGAFCLETQTEPNCINRGEAFFEKGEIYRHETVYEVLLAK